MESSIVKEAGASLPAPLNHPVALIAQVQWRVSSAAKDGPDVDSGSLLIQAIVDAPFGLWGIAHGMELALGALRRAVEAGVLAFNGGESRGDGDGGVLSSSEMEEALKLAPNFVVCSRFRAWRAGRDRRAHLTPADLGRAAALAMERHDIAPAGPEPTKAPALSARL